MLIAASAQAQVASPSQRKEAATHYQRGVSLSKEGDFPAALAEFRAAYQAAPSFEVLFNIGFCERRTFKYGQSLRTFAQYLRLGGEKVAADRRAAVAKEIETIRSLTAPVAVIVEGEPAKIFVEPGKAGVLNQREVFNVRSQGIDVDVRNDGVGALRRFFDDLVGDVVEVVGIVAGATYKHIGLVVVAKEGMFANGVSANTTYQIVGTSHGISSSEKADAWSL